MNHVLIKYGAKLVGGIKMSAGPAERAIFDLLHALIESLILKPRRIDSQAPDAEHGKPPRNRSRGVIA